MNIIKNIFRQVYKSTIGKQSIRYSSWYSAIISKVFRYPPREEVLRIAMNYVSMCQLEGDYLEFGVGDGDIFIPAIYFAKQLKLESMRFYGFDSFEGLQEITGIDANGYTKFKKGLFTYSLKELEKNISRTGVNVEKVKIVPGWFKDTLNKETKQKFGIKSAAIIYIDCDLYESTVPVLNFITDYITGGTILIFDDWFCFRGNPNRGEERAFNEWLKNNPTIKATEFHKIGWHGNSFIMHKI